MTDSSYFSSALRTWLFCFWCMCWRVACYTVCVSTLTEQQLLIWIKCTRFWISKESKLSNKQLFHWRFLIRKRNKLEPAQKRFCKQISSQIIKLVYPMCHEKHQGASFCSCLRKAAIYAKSGKIFVVHFLLTMFYVSQSLQLNHLKIVEFKSRISYGLTTMYPNSTVLFKVLLMIKAVPCVFCDCSRL